MACLRFHHRFLFFSFLQTVGQAILSRELRLDSTDPKDISRLNSLGIREEESRILTALFFPKHKRIIAYSPEPGRFVEAQTTYNSDYPGYKTDTTIIQIHDRQLSSDHLAKERNIYEDQASPSLSRPMTESKTVITAATPEVTPTVVSTEKSSSVSPLPSPPLTTVATTKKRKSSGSSNLLACFKSKKPKSGTEQQGEPTIQPTVSSNEKIVPQQTVEPTKEKPVIDYATTQDGKRIYIDVFRDRPNFNMSYKPHDFENRYILPVVSINALNVFLSVSMPCLRPL